MKRFLPIALILAVWALSIAGIVSIFRLSDHPAAYSPARLVDLIRDGRIAPGTNIFALGGVKSRAHHRRTNDIGVEVWTSIFQDRTYVVLVEADNRVIREITVWKYSHGEPEVYLTSQAGIADVSQKK